MNKLSSEQIDNLITLISQSPCLYDKKHQHYKEINKKNQAWSEIADLVGVDECYCRTAWRSLKDQYIRSQKLGDKNGIKRPYKYYRRLVFLTNNSESYLESDVDDTSQHFTPGSVSSLPRSVSSDYKMKYSEKSRCFPTEEESVESESSFDWPLEPSPKKHCKEEDDTDIFTDVACETFEPREVIIEPRESIIEPSPNDNIDTFFSFMAGMVRSFNLSPMELATLQSKLCSYATQELSKIQNK